MAVLVGEGDCRGLAGQFGPDSDQAVVGRRLFRILPLVGADIVEVVSEVFDHLCPVTAQFFQQFGSSVFAIILQRAD